MSRSKRFRSVRNALESSLDIQTTKSKQELLKITKSTHARQPSQSVMVRLKRLDALRLNQRVNVKDYGPGVIQFLGCVHFAQGLFVGIELDHANGKHDGSYMGKRYFKCKEKHGVLVKQHRVELVESSPQTNEFKETKIYATSSSKIETKTKSNSENDTTLVQELELKHETLQTSLMQNVAVIDELELKISELTRKNQDLTKEKMRYEDEMEKKLSLLEEQLERLKDELNSKESVLQKQIKSHENIKRKFKSKTQDLENMKQKTEDAIVSVLYGDKEKDDKISLCMREQESEDKKIGRLKSQYRILESQLQKSYVTSISEWLFDGSDFALNTL